MKKLLITAIAAAGLAISANAQSILADLDQPLSPARALLLNQEKIVAAAKANPGFYQSLKAAGYVFDGVTLTEGQVVTLQIRTEDYAAINDLAAAKWLMLPHFKTYVASKLSSIGNDTIAAYDWLQAQRLAVVRSQTSIKYDEKIEFLDTIASQVLAAAKAKQ